VTSPCIDAGDPASPIGQEPFPNGGRINMGAYGGTAEASLSNPGVQPVVHPVAHWTFDEGTGTIAHDVAGMNHGAVHGTTWTSGKIGGALGSNGVDDYVDCGNSLLLAPETLTLAFWIYRESTNSMGYVVHKGTGGLFYRDYSIGLYSGGTVEFSFGNDSSSFLSLLSQSKVNTQEWTYIAITRDGSHAAIYLNGSPDSTKNYVFAPENKGQPLIVGSLIGTSWFFKGKIDDLRIYDQPLSQKEIGNLFEEMSR
jgi:hypothetical protein